MSGESCIGGGVSRAHDQRFSLPHWEGVVVVTVLWLRLALNKSLLDSKMPFNDIIRVYTVSDAKAVKQMHEADALGSTSEQHYWMHVKHQLRIAGGDNNVPLQTVRCLYAW